MKDFIVFLHIHFCSVMAMVRFYVFAFILWECDGYIGVPLPFQRASCKFMRC